MNWRPIDTAPLDGTNIIIAVQNRTNTDFIIGEAYFAPESYNNDWWWANTCYSDSHGGPVSEINHPSYWMPLPEPPPE